MRNIRIRIRGGSHAERFHIITECINGGLLGDWIQLTRDTSNGLEYLDCFIDPTRRVKSDPTNANAFLDELIEDLRLHAGRMGRYLRYEEEPPYWGDSDCYPDDPYEFNEFFFALEPLDR